MENNTIWLIADSVFIARVTILDKETKITLKPSISYYVENGNIRNILEILELNGIVIKGNGQFITDKKKYIFYGFKPFETDDNLFITDNLYDMAHEIIKIINKDSNIENLVYSNLRLSNNMIIEKILGRDYYNEGCDTYKCDNNSARDIIYTFDSLKSSLKMHKFIHILSMIIIIIIYILR